MSEAIVDVVLGVVAVDNRTPANNKILLYAPNNVKPGLPTDEVGDNETSLDTAARILKDLTGEEARIGHSGWIETTNIGVMDRSSRFDEETGKRRVSIVYVAALGDSVDLQSSNVKWVNMEEAFNSPLYMDHAEIAQLMMRNL